MYFIQVLIITSYNVDYLIYGVWVICDFEVCGCECEPVISESEPCKRERGPSECERELAECECERQERM